MIVALFIFALVIMLGIITVQGEINKELEGLLEELEERIRRLEDRL